MSPAPIPSARPATGETTTSLRNRGARPETTSRAPRRAPRSDTSCRAASMARSPNCSVPVNGKPLICLTRRSWEGLRPATRAASRGSAASGQGRWPSAPIPLRRREHTEYGALVKSRSMSSRRRRSRHGHDHDAHAPDRRRRHRLRRPRPAPAADGRPPLLMIGQPMDAGGFTTLASHFPDRTVVTYDPRGLGRSTRKDGRVDHDADRPGRGRARAHRGARRRPGRDVRQQRRRGDRARAGRRPSRTT